MNKWVNGLSRTTFISVQSGVYKSAVKVLFIINPKQDKELAPAGKLIGLWSIPFSSTVLLLLWSK